MRKATWKNILTLSYEITRRTYPAKKLRDVVSVAIPEIALPAVRSAEWRSEVGCDWGNTQSRGCACRSGRLAPARAKQGISWAVHRDENRQR